MPRVQLSLSVDIERTPRVCQLEGIFDVPEAKRRTVDFDFDVPIEKRDWKIGLIVGPSGAGKSVCARHLFGDAIVGDYQWHARKSIVDCFEVDSINDATAALSSVGFSSPPSWVKPFHVLSNGEQFRATLARALVDSRELVVIDEFTSVVDRQVAKIGSFAVSKAVRKSDKRFVAVSCHDDIVEWLQPDWVLQPHVGAFEWRSQRRRPDVNLEIVRVNHEAWRWFAPHHYLSASLHRAARCFVGLVDDAPAAFAAVLPFPHASRSNFSSLSRVVVLPDYQGLGLGAYAFTEAIARITAANGRILLTHPSHPALVRVWARSKLWSMNSAPGFAPKQGKTSTIKGIVKSSNRRVAHFKWAGGAWQDEEKNKFSRILWK
jgi:GNAT superfamily N-acetyltransferase